MEEEKTQDLERLTEELCRQHRYVMKLLKIMGVDENDIEDVASEVFIDAYDGLEGLRDGEKLIPWLRSIANRRASKYFRKRSNHREICHMVKTEMGEMDVFDMVADGMTVEAILQEAEKKEKVDELIRSLPEVSRRIIRMRFWGEYRHAEIAEILDINLNTEKSIYRRSLERMKKNYLEIFGEGDSYEENG